MPVGSPGPGVHPAGPTTVSRAALGTLAVLLAALTACTYRMESTCYGSGAPADALAVPDAPRVVPDAPAASPDAPPLDVPGPTPIDVPEAPPDVPSAPSCALACPATGACVVDDEGRPLATVCDGGEVRMRPLVEACGFAAAVAMALDDTCGGALLPRSPRVLWFEAGGDYLVDTPVVIDAPGVALRGDGAAALAFDPPDWRRQGTVFRCLVAAGEACVTLARRPESAWRTGFLYEGILMTWAGSTDEAPEGVIGLRIDNAEGVVVRDAAFEELPGTAIDVRGGASSRFADLAFRATGTRATTALFLACGPPDEPGQPAVCPNGVVASGLRVEGYEVGVWLVTGNAVTIESSEFTSSRRHAILVDGAEAVRIEGCRFMDIQESPSLAAAYVRIAREEGWWWPDVTVDGAYFQCHCREGRYPLEAEVAGTSSVPRPRVRVVGSTFQNCPDGILLRSDPRTEWQCEDDRVVQKVALDPTRYETYTIDDCASDDLLPAHPEECFD